MPRNNGCCPQFEFVDIIFRNGQIRRAVDPQKWRWKPMDFEHDWEIVRWQRSFEGEKK